MVLASSFQSLKGAISSIAEKGAGLNSGVLVFTLVYRLGFDIQHQFNRSVVTVK